MFSRGEYFSNNLKKLFDTPPALIQFNMFTKMFIININFIYSIDAITDGTFFGVHHVIELCRFGN